MRRPSDFGSSRRNFPTQWFAIAVIAVIAIAILGTCAAYAKTDTVEVTVFDKDRVCSGSRNCASCFAN